MDDAKHESNLMSCVHCGLCLSSCPTYLETGSEADSPRGRIVLMRRLHEGSLTPHDPDLVRHLDLCLGCRACETACPSAVPYGDILETARERLREAHVCAPSTSMARAALLATLSNPIAARLALSAATSIGASRVPLPVASRLAGRNSQDGMRLPVVADVPLPPAITAPIGKRRARVGMLTGCVMRVLYGDINADTARVLAANGCEVLVNRRQGCCGALHLHSGYALEGRALARKLIDAFSPLDGLDAIVVNSAGCGSTMKEYDKLFGDDPVYAGRAARFSAKVKDVSEFLDDLGWIAPMRADVPSSRIAYHDACHLAHAQRIREAPRRLLTRIPNAVLVSLDESDVCCGSAGVYNMTEPDMARRLQERKVAAILSTGAETVAAANPGCLAWIQSGLEDSSDCSIRVVHPVTLLAEALAN